MAISIAEIEAKNPLNRLNTLVEKYNQYHRNGRSLYDLWTHKVCLGITGGLTLTTLFVTIYPLGLSGTTVYISLLVAIFLYAMIGIQATGMYLNYALPSLLLEILVELYFVKNLITPEMASKIVGLIRRIQDDIPKEQMSVQVYEALEQIKASGIAERNKNALIEQSKSMRNSIENLRDKMLNMQSQIENVKPELHDLLQRAIDDLTELYPALNPDARPKVKPK